MAARAGVPKSTVARIESGEAAGTTVPYGRAAGPCGRGRGDGRRRGWGTTGGGPGRAARRMSGRRGSALPRPPRRTGGPHPEGLAGGLVGGLVQPAAGAVAVAGAPGDLRPRPAWSRPAA
ncbi:hypothetical protein [Micromonospora inyonensis]|uniref:hypothetical protein n=1 Tax=Micromonospora inyonensis TaxID=47866 RepID=UPI003CCBD51D